MKRGEIWLKAKDFTTARGIFHHFQKAFLHGHVFHSSSPTKTEAFSHGFFCGYLLRALHPLPQQSPILHLPKQPPSLRLHFPTSTLSSNPLHHGHTFNHSQNHNPSPVPSPLKTPKSITTDHLPNLIDSSFHHKLAFTSNHHHRAYFLATQSAKRTPSPSGDHRELPSPPFEPSSNQPPQLPSQLTIASYPKLPDLPLTLNGIIDSLQNHP
ncbi:hypothetical protein V6N13_043828 [Hibiscus sabdariffa]|uniref:Uncharacterized protein n=2 Tax=Hibiscus sabdariffa TaxID=183260 RepID=A0ABR1ZVF6_9ROSI